MVNLVLVLKRIRESLITGNQRVLRERYRNFKEVSAKNYTTTEYPAYEDLQIPKNDVHFMLIYKELYYRHICLDLKSDDPQDGEFRVSITHYQNSFQNYIDLFNRIIELDDSNRFTLPAAWCWDIVNSFVDQYVDYQKFICEPENEEHRKKKIWETPIVLKYLHFLALQSGFNVHEPLSDQLALAKKTLSVNLRNRDSMFCFGFFSLCGLLRVYAALGDFATALVASKILFMYQERQSKLSPSFRIISSFYRGYCLFMTRRWREADQRLSYVFQNATQRNDGYYKMSKILLALLGALSFDSSSLAGEDLDGGDLEPQQLREAIEQGDNFAGILETFKLAIPYLTPDQINRHCEACKRILPDLQHTSVRPLLDLYTSISLQKLGEHPSLAKSTDLEIHCTLLRQKLQNTMEHEVSDLMTGTQIQSSELAFYIDHNTMHVSRIHKPFPQSDALLRAIEDLSRVGPPC